MCGSDIGTWLLYMYMYMVLGIGLSHIGRVHEDGSGIVLVGYMVL